MKPYNQEEYNTLCVKFLGAVSEQWYPPNKDTKSTGVHWAFSHGSWYPDNKRYHTDGLLKFHSDWNWVHEVVDKIFSLKSDLKHHYHLCVLLELALKTNKKEAVVQAIWEFLNFYYENEMTPQQ